ncbi:MAG: F0F1 ATP synthase subunit A [Bryobacteraceae bacterium]
MHEELWLTRIFNDHLAGVANSILEAVGQHAHNSARPWENWIVMEILVLAILVVLLAVLKSSFSVDKPGRLQHLFEVIYEFLKDTTAEAGIHHGEKYIPFFGTLFIFILFSNLIGIIPGFESPTMFAWVPAGLAIVTFVYYNAMGVRENGLGYLKHFLGPIWWLIPLMVPIEIVSNFARPLSLTIRLYANMFAGEQVTMAFMKLVPLVVPVAFMGLHIFVSFLQAYIFTLLTMIYVGGAVEHEH